jgi:hypothetical protein
MKFTPTQIHELAADARFPAENLEKVLRLRDLLIEFHKHTALNGKLVLKGGTALNLFYLNLARLSVDIDLNYITIILRWLVDFVFRGNRKSSRELRGGSNGHDSRNAIHGGISTGIDRHS